MTGLPKLHFTCPEQPFDEKMIKVKFITINFFETLSELFFILTKKVVKVIKKLMYRRKTSRKKLLNKTLVVMLNQLSTYPEKKTVEQIFFFVIFGFRANILGILWKNYWQCFENYFCVSRGTILGCSFKLKKVCWSVLVFERKNRTFVKKITAGLPKVQFTCPEQNFKINLIKVHCTVFNFVETLCDFFVLTKQFSHGCQKTTYWYQKKFREKIVEIFSSLSFSEFEQKYLEF